MPKTRRMENMPNSTGSSKPTVSALRESLRESRYQATTQTLDRARRPAAVPEETDVTKLMNFVKSELRRLTSLPTVTADEYRLRALTVDPLQWQERSANWHMAERMAGHTEL